MHRQQDLPQKGQLWNFSNIHQKNKIDNFKSVGELVDYLKNQKDKLKNIGVDVDFLYKQKPRLTKEKKQKNIKVKEFDERLKKYEDVLSGPEEIESDTFLFKKFPQAN